MRVVFTRPFIKAYDRLDSKVISRTQKALALLSSNPGHPSLCLKRVKSTADVWEARIDRDYPMTFKIEADCCVMRNIGKHDEVLGSP